MNDKVELVYPLYLNVSMMTSFLAALEDGIAYDTDIVRRQEKKKDAGGEGAGRVGLPTLGSLFGINIDLKGKVTEANSTGNSEETKLVRKHTEASLFVHLRHELYRQDEITKLDNWDDVGKIKHGSLMEATGPILRNPLHRVFEGFDQVADLLDIEMYKANPPTSSRSNAQKKKAVNNQQPKQSFANFRADAVDHKILGMKVIAPMRDDLNNSSHPTSDICSIDGAEKAVSGRCFSLTISLLPVRKNG